MADLTIKIKGDSVSVENALKKTNQSLKKTQQQTKNTAKSADPGLKAAYMAVAAILTGVVAQAFKRVNQLAIDFEESNAKFGTVFQNNSKEANAMRKELVKSYGLSSLAATDMLASIQDFLIPMGVARKEATGLSGDFVKLARDLGSFNNAPTVDVMNAIKSALSGITMPMKRFGVDVSIAGLEQQLLNEGLDKSVRSLSRSEKAQLIYRKIVADSTDAMGDFKRTADSTANTMVSLKSIAEDTVLVLGQRMVAAINPSLVELRKFLQSEEGLKAINKAINGIWLGLSIVKEAIIAQFRPFALLLKIMTDGFNAIWGLIDETVIKAFNAIIDKIKSVGNFINEVKGKIFTFAEETGTAINEKTGGALDGITTKTQEVLGAISTYWEENKGIVTNGYDEIARLYKELMENNGAATIEGMDLIVNSNETGAEKVKKTWKDVYNTIKGMVKKNEMTSKESLASIWKNTKLVSDGIVTIYKNQYDAIDEADTAARDKKRGELRKAWHVQKALNYSETVITTAAAAMAAYKAMAGIPIIGPLLAALAAADAIAAGVVQMGIIKNTPAPFAAGGDFVTDGPQTIQVGDNPSGRERVSITPEEDINNSFSESMNFNIGQIIVQANNPQEFGDQMREFGILTARRA
jgi:hypothetical protein